MVEMTNFDVEIPTRKTIDEEEIMAHDSSSNEGKYIMTHGYNLIYDRVRRLIKPPLIYDCADLICYTLDVDEELKKS